MFAAKILGFLVGAVAWLWLKSLRLTVLIDDALDMGDPRPFVLSFFHGEQFALLAWPRRRKTVALVSLSRDGELQSRALRVVGMRVERGSTSRGGARGLAAIVRRLRRGEDAAFAVDGPRGPRFHVSPGAIAAAKACGGSLVPMGSAMAKGFVFEKAWDHFALPRPFSRVVVCLGPPLPPTSSPAALGAAIERASALASAHLRVLGCAPSCATSSRSAQAKFPST